MRHYELDSGVSRKFWEIDLLGQTVTVRYGRAGTRGRRMQWRFASRDEAKRDWEQRIYKKTRAGYQLTYSEPMKTPADNDGPSLHCNPELEADIVANPNDDDAILVYGDWLAERDDPRGQLILTYREMHAERDPTRFIELKKHATEIVDNNTAAFYGRFLDFCDRARIRWRLGFFDDVLLSEGYDRLSRTETLSSLLEAPASLFLRTLSVHDFDRPTARMLMKRRIPTLQRIELSFRADVDEPATWPMLSNLFDLRVAPKLHGLTLVYLDDPEEFLKGLSRSKLAKQLEELSLPMADLSYEDADGVADRFPKLRKVVFDQLDDDYMARLNDKLSRRAG